MTSRERLLDPTLSYSTGHPAARDKCNVYTQANRQCRNPIAFQFQGHPVCVLHARMASAWHSWAIAQGVILAPRRFKYSGR